MVGEQVHTHAELCRVSKLSGIGKLAVLQCKAMVWMRVLAQCFGECFQYQLCCLIAVGMCVYCDVCVQRAVVYLRHLLRCDIPQTVFCTVDITGPSQPCGKALD